MTTATPSLNNSPWQDTSLSITSFLSTSPHMVPGRMSGVLFSELICLLIILRAPRSSSDVFEADEC